ncbi:hypothetical protein R5H30_02810 [Sulfitobacter sp. D35]|uniref:hypothetical protein n=1 Tax=Sulfitobacter sp. D35 TaxID=3083252 RepID=UPI00296FE4DF|nr:hypothetical protein [Sulfitobacter sp. D35]MDW4496898.1 hypothetical protein [Sulfitobacter sp. D35]
MITWIGLGFLAVFLLAFWLAGRVGASSGSGMAGLLMGILSFVVLMGGYLVALALWARSLFVTFVETELPLLTEKLLLFLERFETFRETI